MQTIKRIFKFLLLSLILLIVSGGYRIFGKKSADEKTNDSFLGKKASADAPPIGSCQSGCTGCSSGGCTEGGEGDS